MKNFFVVAAITISSQLLAQQDKLLTAMLGRVAPSRALELAADMLVGNQVHLKREEGVHRRDGVAEVLPGGHAGRGEENW